MDYFISHDKAQSQNQHVTSAIGAQSVTTSTYESWSDTDLASYATAHVPRSTLDNIFDSNLMFINHISVITHCYAQAFNYVSYTQKTYTITWIALSVFKKNILDKCACAIYIFYYLFCSILLWKTISKSESFGSFILPAVKKIHRDCIALAVHS